MDGLIEFGIDRIVLVALALTVAAASMIARTRFMRPVCSGEKYERVPSS